MRACAIIAVVTVASAHAHADPPRSESPELEQVRQLEAGLEYERALVLADQTIGRGGLGAEDLARLHFEAGKLAAGLDHADAAADHFAKALAIDPSLALPAGTSPKISEPFQDVRARSHALAMRVNRDPNRLTVEVDDPLHLVVQIRAEAQDDAGRVTELATRGAPPFVLALPANARDVHVTALDEHGNRVAERAVPAVAVAVARPPVRATSAWYTSWKVWGSVAVVGVAGFGGICAWRESVAQDEWNRLENDTVPHDFSQLRAVEDRGRNWALAANISFGIAGTGALIVALAWVTGRAGSDPPPPIAVTAGPGAIGVAGRF